jgi:hypothetical protein
MQFEPFWRRERSRKAVEREPTGEILSEAKDLHSLCLYFTAVAFNRECVSK